jgi:hypothetical protein
MARRGTDQKVRAMGVRPDASRVTIQGQRSFFLLTRSCKFSRKSVCIDKKQKTSERAPDGLHLPDDHQLFQEYRRIILLGTISLIKYSGEREEQRPSEGTTCQFAAARTGASRSSGKQSMANCSNDNPDDVRRHRHRSSRRKRAKKSNPFLVTGPSPSLVAIRRDTPSRDACTVDPHQGRADGMNRLPEEARAAPSRRSIDAAQPSGQDRSLCPQWVARAVRQLQLI